MSLFSSLILPSLEKELKALEPQIALFICKQLKSAATEIIEWTEEKINVDLNGDGVIGDSENEA